MKSESAAPADRLRMLAVFASPVANEHGSDRPGGAALDVWSEWEALQAALSARDPVSNRGAPWDVVRLSPPTAEALGDALVGHCARVVHLAGHGCSEGLYLEDDLGRERLVTTSELIRQLRGRGVELVVLNACATADVAGQLVAAGVAKAVVAMREPIYDRESALLAGRLYARLGSGDSLATALTAARQSLKERIRSAHPVLGLGDKDPEARAANWILVGDGGLRLRSAHDPAGLAKLHRLATPHNDPPFGKLRGFVGRHAELYRLAEWLASPGGRVFVLHGIGGVGKTTLALNAALRASHRFAAFAWASAKETPELGALVALGAVAAATGQPLRSEEATNPIAALIRRLNESPILLVLDNFESVAEGCASELAQVVDGLEPGCGSRTLVTLRPKDRSPLTNGVPKGGRLHLETLDLPSALARAFDEVLCQGARNPPEPAGPVDAEVATAATLAGLEWLPAPWLVALGKLARGAGCHPKLLDLATASVGSEGWEETFTRLRLLLGRELEPALEEMIGAILDVLAQSDPAAVTVLHAARLFPAGAPAEHLARVATGARLEDDESRIAFEDGPRRAALDSGLLRRDGHCFDLDPPVRRFLEIRRKLDSATERTLRLRQGEIAAEQISAVDKLLVTGKLSPASFPERQNLTTTWEWLAAASREDDEAARLLLRQAGSWRNLLLNSYDLPRRILLEAVAVAAGRLGDRLGEAKARQALGNLEQFEDRLPEARRHYDAALALFRSVDSRRGEANTRLALGNLEQFEDRLPEARRHYDAALALFRSVDSRRGEANTRLALGDLEQFEARLPEARRHYDAALEHFRGVGDRLGEANSRQALGDLERFAARFPEARRHYDSALAHFHGVGSRLGEANTLSALARLTLVEGDDERARELLDEALDLYRQIGARKSIPAQLGNFGCELLRLGREEEARGYYLTATAEFDALGYGQHAARQRAAAEAIPTPTQM
jgi:tetratricopeptide (TPR) repeat protein